MKRELRISAVPRALELRQNADGTRSIVGEAVVYNTFSEDLGGWRERIEPGAFTNSLRTTEVMALYSHDQADILGRQSSGTLTITDGPDALRFECKLPNTTVGRDVQELCARGDLKGMSFGFSCVQDDWTTGADGTVIRTVQEAGIYEVSVVASPAYMSSTVSLRSCPPNLRAKLAPAVSVRAESKMVDGKQLFVSAFAYVGDRANPDTWKLPIKFPRIQQTISHIKDALARFNQTEDIPEDQKAEVYARIVGAAKAHGITVAKESYRDLPDADPDAEAALVDDTDTNDTDTDDPLAGEVNLPDDEDDTEGDDDEDEDRSDLLRVRLLYNARRRLINTTM